MAGWLAATFILDAPPWAPLFPPSPLRPTNLGYTCTMRSVMQVNLSSTKLRHDHVRRQLQTMPRLTAAEHFQHSLGGNMIIRLSDQCSELFWQPGTTRQNQDCIQGMLNPCAGLAWPVPPPTLQHMHYQPTAGLY